MSQRPKIACRIDGQSDLERLSGEGSGECAPVPMPQAGSASRQLVDIIMAPLPAVSRSEAEAAERLLGGDLSVLLGPATGLNGPHTRGRVPGKPGSGET